MLGAGAGAPRLGAGAGAGGWRRPVHWQAGKEGCRPGRGQLWVRTTPTVSPTALRAVDTPAAWEGSQPRKAEEREEK